MKTRTICLAAALALAFSAAATETSVSYTAGTFVCNHLMYGVLYHIAKEFPGMKGGFMHVPYLHEQALKKPNTPSLSKDDIVKGIEAAIAAIVENETDAAVRGGNLD